MEGGDRDWYQWTRDTFADPTQAALAARAAREALDVGAPPESVERAARNAAARAAAVSAGPVLVNATAPVRPVVPPPGTPAGFAPASPLPPGPPGAAAARSTWWDENLVAAIALVTLVLVAGGALAYHFASQPAAPAVAASRALVATSAAPASPLPAAAATTTGSLCGGGTLAFPDGNGCYHPGADPGLPAAPAGATIVPYAVRAADWVTLVQQLRSSAPACDPRFDLPSPSLGYCVVRFRVVEQPFAHVSAARNPDGSCHIASVNVTYRLEVTIPSWTPGPGTPVELVGSYHRWLAGLYAHARGKIRLAQVEIAKLSSAIRAGTCDQGNQQGILQSWLDRANAGQIDYDRTTLGGDTEAPGFP